MPRPSRTVSKSLPQAPEKPRSAPKRQPRRASRANEKSKYFEPPTDDDDEKDSLSFDDADKSSSEESAPVTSETDVAEPPRKRSRATPKKGVSPKNAKKSPTKGKTKGQEEEPWETFIPKEATPEAGDVEYREDGIHPNTLQFLTGLGSLQGFGLIERRFGEE
jgi:hypothetical protein